MTRSDLVELALGSVVHRRGNQTSVGVPAHAAVCGWRPRTAWEGGPCDPYRPDSMWLPYFAIHPDCGNPPLNACPQCWG